MIVIPVTLQSLPNCDDINYDYGILSPGDVMEGLRICDNEQELKYWYVDSTIGILDINEINEDKQSIQLQLQIMLEWFDNRIKLHGIWAKDTLEFEVPPENYDDLKIPKIMFIKSKSSEIVPLYGDNKYSVSSFWMYWQWNLWDMEFQWRMQYSQSVNIELGCYFNFEEYPFDQDHECLLEFYTPSYDIDKLELEPPKIFDPFKTSYQRKNQSTLKIKNKALPYEVKVKVLEYPPVIDSNGFNFSVAGIGLNLQRKSNNLIMTNYFMPIGLFAALSNISFVIKPEIVIAMITMCENFD